MAHICKHPLKYGSNYLKSLIKKKRYTKEGDFYLYGLKSVDEFEKRVKKENSLLIVGFSYCQKPFECPSGRFTDKCIADCSNEVCQQCDIGKIRHFLPKERVITLLIPTIHYIGEKIFEIIEANPKKEVLFVITACELTLEMFADFGNMVNVKGIGVRLDGRICNTMEAFVLSERGIKPGLTLVTEPTLERVLSLFR